MVDKHFVNFTMAILLKQKAIEVAGTLGATRIAVRLTYYRIDRLRYGVEQDLAIRAVRGGMSISVRRGKQCIVVAL